MRILEEIIRIKKDRGYILSKLPKAELLTQLAEEGAELTHAALKLRRAVEGTNPTPITVPDAVDMLQEEVSDVLLLINLLDLDWNEDAINETMERKILRWASRLREREGKNCGA